MPPGPGKNKSGNSGTGLKILWIPGRKKNHDKGIYKPTKHDPEHKHGDRKNEPWSLGGSKAHDDIVGGNEKGDKDDLLNPSTPTASILPSASLGVSAVNVDDCSESDSEIKLAKKSFDSIERFDDLDGHPNGTSSLEKPKSCKKKSKEDKAVKCLYYTMMCCECTIS